jgi:hypothetical protein
VNTTRANNSILYALVIGFLRRLGKGFVLTAALMYNRACHGGSGVSFLTNSAHNTKCPIA